MTVPPLSGVADKTHAFTFKEIDLTEVPTDGAHLVYFTNDKVHQTGFGLGIASILYGHRFPASGTFENILKSTAYTIPVKPISKLVDQGGSTISVPEIRVDEATPLQCPSSLRGSEGLTFYPPRESHFRSGREQHDFRDIPQDILDEICSNGSLKAIRLTDFANTSETDHDTSGIPVKMMWFLTTAKDSLKEDGSNPLNGIRQRWRDHTAAANESVPVEPVVEEE